MLLTRKASTQAAPQSRLARAASGAMAKTMDRRTFLATSLAPLQPALPGRAAGAPATLEAPPAAHAVSLAPHPPAARPRPGPFDSEQPPRSSPMDIQYAVSRMPGA